MEREIPVGLLVVAGVTVPSVYTTTHGASIGSRVSADFGIAAVGDVTYQDAGPQDLELNVAQKQALKAAAECTWPTMTAAKVRIFELKQNVAGGGILTGMRVMASEQVEATYTQYYADMNAGLVPKDGIDTVPVGNVDYQRKLSKDWTPVVDCLDEYEAMSQAVWGQTISTVPKMRCTRARGVAPVYCSSNLIYTVTPAAAWAAGIGKDKFIAVE